MPFYEYQAVDTENSCDSCRQIFETSHSILSPALSECPKCGNPIKRLISLIQGVVIAGREANQYSDIKRARFWRDKNGVRHPVTTADGHVNSATVSKQTATAEEMKVIKKEDIKQGTKDRLKAQKMRADDWNKKQLEK